MKTTSLVASPLVSILHFDRFAFRSSVDSTTNNSPAQGTQDASAEPVTMPLWEGKAPGALCDTDSDKPALTVYASWTGHRPTLASLTSMDKMHIAVRQGSSLAQRSPNNRSKGALGE